MKVLEIGCGAGRVTRAFAGFFGEVYAVDISREMVRQARDAVAGFPNTHVFRNNGKDLSVVDGGWREPLGNRPDGPSGLRIFLYRLSAYSEPEDHRELCARSAPLAPAWRPLQIPSAGLRRWTKPIRTIAG